MSTQQPPIHFFADGLIVPPRVHPTDRRFDRLTRVPPHGVANRLPLGRRLLTVDLGHPVVDDFNL
jgi:hypothetical protein